MRYRPVPNPSTLSGRHARARLHSQLHTLLVLTLLAVTAVSHAANLQRVLVFDKHLASQTEPYAAADSMLTRLGREMGFALRISSDSTLFHDDTLKRYQVVVWNNVMRNVLSGPQQQAFTRYMENGGGYVGFHAAATNRRLWPWYVDDFLGGDNFDASYIAWGKTTLYADTIPRAGHETGAHHFIMKGIPRVIPQDGEWYRWNPNPADNPAITILQWYQPKTIQSDWPQALPISWCREYGAAAKKGRLFYIQVSHMDSVYASAWYRTLVGNALKWVAHDDATAAALRGDPSGPSTRPVADPAAVEPAYLLDGREVRRRP